MSGKRWPVSDRDVKPWWFHAVNYAAFGFAVFCLLVVMSLAVIGWARLLEGVL